MLSDMQLIDLVALEGGKILQEELRQCCLHMVMISEFLEGRWFSCVLSR